MKHDRRKRQPSKPIDPWSDANPADVGPQTAAQLVGQVMRKPKGGAPNVYHRQRKDYFAFLVRSGHINGTHEAVANKAVNLYLSTQKGLGGQIKEYVDGRSDPTMAAVLRVDVRKRYADVLRDIPMGPLRDVFQRVVEKGLPIVDEGAGGKNYRLAARRLRAALECLPL